MHATNIRNLKKNPSLALRQAKQGPVLVLKGNEPDAVILHLDGVLKDSEATLRPALSASLYRDGTLSLGAAARLSTQGYGGFLQHLAMLGIDNVIGTVRLLVVAEQRGLVEDAEGVIEAMRGRGNRISPLLLQQLRDRGGRELPENVVSVGM